MDKLYSVALQGMSDLPRSAAIEAEVRFIKTLERSLGSEEAVVSVYRAWSEASESHAIEVGVEQWALANKWPGAFEAAQRAGMRDIGEGDAHFELHLSRHTAAAD